MRAPLVGFILGAALALVACGKQGTADQHGAAGVPPSAALKAPAAGAANNRPKASALKHLNEDGTEIVEDAAGDSGSHNPMLAAVASAVAATTSVAGAQTLTPPTPWQEGVNYTRMVPAQPTAVPQGQVEVLEFFWYACPHCYAIDPQVEAWKKNKPAYVTFTRVPVTWTEGHRSLARLYYTLESLGKSEQLHADIFKEIHDNDDPLIGRDPADKAAAERIQSAFVQKFGIPQDAFEKAYQSAAVDKAVQNADQLVQRYRVDGVPTFVVNGKYKADVRTAGGPDRLLLLVDDLAALEHRHP